MRQYLDLIETVLEKGRTKKGRGIHPMKSIFGYQMRFDLRGDQMPILTTKKMPPKWMITELLWFISGKCENTQYLKKLSADAGMTRGVDIWDSFADKTGNLGPIYGCQWRHWPKYVQTGENTYNVEYIDQLANVINEIKTYPDSKALIVSAWNPSMHDQMILPACHTFFQFDVRKGKLRCQLYQRSGDVFLGVPFNIFQYALLTKMVAQVTGLEAREFIHTIGDAHIYHNHLEAAKEQLTRTPKKLPKMKLNKNIKNIDDFTFNDFELIDYDSYPAIKGELIHLSDFSKDE
jgi:thymidylate synthase